MARATWRARGLHQLALRDRRIQGSREFYEYVIGPPAAKRDNSDYQVLNRWDGSRPLIEGEEFYFDGMGNLAWFGGPKVYRGKQHRDAAGGRYGRMLTEGGRWQDVSRSTRVRVRCRRREGAGRTSGVCARVQQRLQSRHDGIASDQGVQRHACGR